MLILHAAREVVEAEGFQDVLDGVRARVDEIESLHRTRELTVNFSEILRDVTNTYDLVQGRITTRRSH